MGCIAPLYKRYVLMLMFFKPHTTWKLTLCKFINLRLWITMLHQPGIDVQASFIWNLFWKPIQPTAWWINYLLKCSHIGLSLVVLVVFHLVILNRSLHLLLLRYKT